MSPALSTEPTIFMSALMIEGMPDFRVVLDSDVIVPAVALLAFENMACSLQEIDWIHRFAVDQHLVVQVRPRGSARTAEQADLRPVRDFLAFLDRDLGEMGVSGADAEAVVDLHQAPILPMPTREDDPAWSGA